MAKMQFFPQGKLQKRHIALLLALLLVIALAIWVFRPTDDLRHLKRTEEVTEGTEEAVQTVRDLLAAARAEKPRKAFAPLMYVRDGTELDRLTAPLLEKPEMGELEFLGCSKLAVSHRDNLAVHAYSANRQKSYAFYLVKDKQGVWKFADLGLSKRRPRP